MPPPTLPLPKLAQQLARKQTELDRLRRTYETRLTNLLRRKETLEATLRDVEAEIQVATLETTAALPASTLEAPAPTEKQSLLNALIAIVREKGKPMTVRQLVEELQARAYPTASQNLSKMVSNRVLDLVHKKVFSRSGKGKVVLARKRGRPVGSTSTKQATTQKAASNGAATRRGQPTLPTVITSVLSQSTEPIKAADLANLVVAAGYKTKSKSPVDLIWATVGKMENVENVRGQGYRLKT